MSDEQRTRRATPEDAHDLVLMRHALFRAMSAAGAAARPGGVDDTSWYSAAQDVIGGRMAEGSLAAFVIDVGPSSSADRGKEQGLAACAIATLTPRLPGPGFPTGLFGSMSTVFVQPSHRRRGLARAVVVAALDWLDDQGAELVDLNATPDAASLYRSLGFSEPRAVALRRTSNQTLHPGTTHSTPRIG